MYRSRFSESTPFPPNQFEAELRETANKIVARGKGILAADESTGTIGNRFQKINLENNEANRRDYRELLFRAAGWSDYISGVILFEETLSQKAADGTPLVEVIKAAGVIPGIKVDKGIANIPGTEGETLTQGIDGLGARCEEYYKKGARFAKWRSVLKISANCPSDVAVRENARGLALYAAICQQNGLVPIVEPEILMDGDHSIEVTLRVSVAVWEATIKALQEQHVYLEGILLKPSMVTAGVDYKGKKPSQFDIAHATITCFQRTIPPAIPGIVFLSGGQSEEEATVNLDAMNKLVNKGMKAPWALSFSYGRALQASTIKAWGGKPENVKIGQDTFLARAKANSLAQKGEYAASSSSSEAESLYVRDYKY